MADPEDLLNYYDYYDNNETTPTQYITLYVSPFLLFFSTTGNTLALVVLSRLCYEVWSSCVYLAIMSVMDLLIVYTWCGNDWLLEVTGFNVSTQLLLSSVSVCKVYMFLFNAIFHMNRWLMVCLAIDLFIAVKYPDKIQELCTLSRAKAIILLLTVILACINLHHFWTYEIINIKDIQVLDEDLYTCTFVKQGVPHSELFEHVIWPIVNLSVANILPLTIIIVCTILTIIECVRGNGLVEIKKENWRKKYLLYPNAMKQLKIATLVICIAYILTVPKLLLNLYQFIYDPQYVDLVTTIFFNLEYIFWSLKFYILFICCRQFRAKCFNICGRMCRYNKKNQSSETISPVQKVNIWSEACKLFRPNCACSYESSTSGTAVQSRRALMASNPSSTEFQTDTTMQHTNNSYRCSQHQSGMTDIEHTIV